MRTFGLLLLSLVGCATDDDGPSLPTADCVPSREQWLAEVEPIVEQRCTMCHALMPRYGAPFSLHAYERLIEGPEGERIVDRMAHRVSEGTMPPVGAPLPTLAERDVITSWASCGAVHVESPVGVESNRPAFIAPEAPPDGLRTLDLTANGYEVASTVRDHYEDFDFTHMVEEDVFIRRIEATIDEERVIHHLTLRRGDPELEDAGMTYLYTWAPGTGAFQFPDGGLRMRPDDILRLQVHYNNGAMIEGVSDSSGVRLWVGPVEGTEYVMAELGPGPFGFEIPARSAQTISSDCTVTEPMRVLASMPHMHEIGRSFAVDIVRESMQSNVLALGSWSFQTQLFYDLPITLLPGDLLTVRCDYMNESAEPVRAGTRTRDEMCYAFTYVTPPNARFCNTGAASRFRYEPGECIESPITPPVVRPTATTESPVLDETQVMPSGMFAIERVLLVTPNPAIVGVATVQWAGQMRLGDGRFELDGAVHIVAPVDPLRNGVQVDLSAAGSASEVMGAIETTADCGNLRGGTLGVVGGQPVLRLPFAQAGLDIVAWAFFSPAT